MTAEPTTAAATTDDDTRTGHRTGVAGSDARARRWRALPLLPAGLCLLAGLDAALLLLGLPAPVAADRLPDVHGMVLVLGFLGTVIALERAVALGLPSGYLAPGLLGTGGLALISPAPPRLGQLLLLAGALALLPLYRPLWLRQRDPGVLAQALGAVLAAGAALLWSAGVPVPNLLPWLTGFVALTIAGERVELARPWLGRTTGRDLTVAAGAMTAAAPATLLFPGPGHTLFGLALVGGTGWLLHRDVARRTVRSRGASRFTATAVLAGYGWLLVAGAIWLFAGAVTDGPGYDALAHAVFLGFALSMVMAHAPVILPAVLRRPLPYRPVLWSPLLLLHASLLLRLGAGDALGHSPAHTAGGVLNVAALLLFVLTAGWCALWAGREGRAR